MAEAKGPKTQKGREAAAESWPRGGLFQMTAREVLAEALADGRGDR